MTEQELLRQQSELALFLYFALHLSNFSFDVLHSKPDLPFYGAAA